MADTTHIGDVAVAVLTAALLKARYNVLKPVSDGLRYDLVIERDGLFQRVQCKTGKVRAGALKFRTCSVTNGVHKTYVGAADLFGVYCPATDRTYLVPVAECGCQVATLRVEPSRNKQVREVRLATEYEILPR